MILVSPYVFFVIAIVCCAMMVLFYYIGKAEKNEEMRLMRDYLEAYYDKKYEALHQLEENK